MFDIYKEIQKLIKKPDIEEVRYIYFEDCQQQSNKNVQTFHKLSMVKAMILFACYNQSMSYTCLAPSTWRNILSKHFKIKFGRSRADQKAKAKEFVKTHFNIDASEDECDAICLGYAGILDKKSKKTA